MHKIRFILFILLLSLTMMTALLLQAWAGSGITTFTSNGQVLDLTVFFDDAKQIQSNWIYNFNDSHKMLYKASRGMLRFGKIRIGYDKSVAGRADIRIDKIGHASVTQPDTRERTSLGTEDTLWLFEEDVYAPIVTLHELGHYVFTLSDEYKSNIFKMVNGKVTVVEKGNESESFCSTKDSDNKAHSCLMYDNHSPNSVYLFCGPEHKKLNTGSTTRAGNTATPPTRRRPASRRSCAGPHRAGPGIPAQHLRHLRDGQCAFRWGNSPPFAWKHGD